MSMLAIARWCRFLSKNNPDGMSKSSSGIVTVVYDNDKIHENVNNGSIYIEINGYDILDWPRCFRLGPFKDEIDAITKSVQILTNATIEINKELIEDKRKSLLDPADIWQMCLSGTLPTQEP